jgi:hypothetical protein
VSLTFASDMPYREGESEMRYLLLLILVLCAGAVVIGLAVPRARILRLWGASGLIYTISWILWWFAIYFQVILVDNLLLILQRYQLDRFQLVTFAPPLLPVLAFLWFTRRSAGGR